MFLYLCICFLFILALALVVSACFYFDSYACSSVIFTRFYSVLSCFFCLNSFTNCFYSLAVLQMFFINCPFVLFIFRTLFFLGMVMVDASEPHNHLRLPKAMSEIIHCVKSVQMRSFFSSVFSRIRTEYREILRIPPYSVRMPEDTDQKKLRIWTHFTQ